MILLFSGLLAFIFIVLPALVAIDIYTNDRTSLRSFRKHLEKGQGVILERGDNIYYCTIEAVEGTTIVVRFFNNRLSEEDITNIYPMNYYHKEEIA